MTAATLTENIGGQWTISPARSEQGLTYDLNGNINTLERTDETGQPMQSLDYNYNGNLLSSVDVNGDPSQPFEYDSEGNMTYDGMSEIGIEYNILNLPAKIFVGTDTISYIYTAAGERLAARLTTPSVSSLTIYRSVMVYGADAGGQEQLLYMLQPEGLVSRAETSNGEVFTYKYFKTDHTGSTRVLLAARDTSYGTEMQFEQTSDYYPFGLAWETNNLNQNRYLYSGKEIEDALLNGSPLALYYFGARYYNPTLGRWFNVDPANQFSNPYLYAGNSPGMYIDPDGEWVWLIPVVMGAINSGMQSYMNGGSFWQGAAIGAAAGLIGVGVGAGVSAIVGQSSGFLGGAISGFAGGFAGSASGAWMSGANFGDGLKAGLVGGGIGAAMGGLVGGANAVENGGNFWTGKGTTFEFGVGRSLGRPQLSDSPYDATINDDILKGRILQEYSIREGDFGIEKITTAPGDYQMLTDGRYYSQSDKSIVGGYMRSVSWGRSEVHISPFYSNHSVLAEFRAITGHELIHAYHWNKFGYSALKWHYAGTNTEMVAYRYTFNTYVNAGMVDSAYATMRTAHSLGYWKAPSPEYKVFGPYLFR
jgi:RHS repeat-associated protein